MRMRVSGGRRWVGARRIHGIMLGLAALLVAGTPAPPASGTQANDDARLRAALTTFITSAEVLRIDAVPDLYEGGYARISVYAKRAMIASNGLRLDEVRV